MFYLFDGLWGILAALLLSVLLCRRTLIGGIREWEFWGDTGKALLVWAACWFLIAFFPKYLWWLWMLLRWIDYDYVAIAGLVLGMILFVFYYRVRDQESEWLIFAAIASISFLYIVVRVGYIHFTHKASGLLGLLA